jgi:hypothetical protein
LVEEAIGCGRTVTAATLEPLAPEERENFLILLRRISRIPIKTCPNAAPAPETVCKCARDPI